MLTIDLMLEAQGLPDGLYDDRAYGLRFAVCGHAIAAWLDRDRMERDRPVLNPPWGLEWGAFPDPAEVGAWSAEQRAESRERRAESRERRAESRERRAESRERGGACLIF